MVERMGGLREGWAPLGVEPGLRATAEAFAAIPPGLGAEDRRALARVALAVLQAGEDGHTRLPLAADGPDLLAWVERPALALAFGPPGAPRPFVRGAGWIVSSRMHAAEVRLASALCARAQGPAVAAPDPEDLLEAPVRLSEEQREAVRRAATAPFTLITGGPGTGKTSIVAALLRAAVRGGLAPEEVALAAPTGKAAQRMGEALRATLDRIAGSADGDLRLRERLPEPQTLHRLLAFLPARQSFRHHRANPLPHRLVVVDEGSMVGLELMDGLAAALGEGARLVVLGDADQLPSVEAGAVFRDLVAALPEATVRLTRSFRMDAADPAGRSVLLAARALRAGDAAALDAPGALAPRTSAADLLGRGAEHAELEGPALRAFLAGFHRAAFLERPGFRAAAARTYPGDAATLSAEDQAALEALFQAHERVKVLCPVKDVPGLASVQGLNQELHRRAGGREAGALDHGQAAHPGEPLMVTVNDYRRGLFNGDLGVAVQARFEEGLRPAVAFRAPGGFRLLPHRPLQGQLDLAWALTVHKAQGSEFDRVVLVLPGQDSPLLTREVLYTALTRAREGATVLGSRAALEAGLARSTPRFTGLAEAFAGLQSPGGITDAG